VTGVQTCALPISDFYNRIVSLPNVQLISITSSNFDLIDNSKTVVTITGTAGWEAVVRGKPVLIFGHAWYKFCEGVFFIQSEKDCREAFVKIQSGFTIDKELVHLFLAIVQQIGVNAYVEPAFAKIVNFSPDQNVTRLVDAIRSFYIQITSKKS